jgi:hypothetical protein
MVILYPSNPLRGGESDEQFAPEVEAVLAAGVEVFFFSLEEFQAGEFRTSPRIPAGSTVLYRGWMLSAAEYEKLASALIEPGAKSLIPVKEYLSNHYLPNWYPLIKDLTPETRIYSAESDLEVELRNLNWPEYFIKDYVKSLKTSGGSRISKPEQIRAVVSQMRRFRGTIEGGFCVRRVERFLPETERRCFVLNKMPFAPEGDVPPVVHECAKRLPGRFFSVDIIQRDDGQLRIVEVGDGQVSDLVGWTPERFANILRWLEKS